MNLANIFALIVCTAALNIGCHKSGASVTGAKTVAIITPAVGNEFNSEIVAGAAEQAKMVGWNSLKHLAPAGDSSDADLASLAIKAISDKPDAISVCGMEASSLERVVKRANAEGVLIFVHNQLTPVAGDVAAYIGYDEFVAGSQCGDYAVELLSNTNKRHQPVGQVAIIDGSPGEHSSKRANGFREAVKYKAGVQIVEEKSGDWQKNKAEALVADWLKRYPNLAVIFACNDNMAIGAVHAVYAAGLAGEHRSVQVMGFGGSHEALVRVKYGDLASTLAVEPRKMGSRIVHEMMDIFGGSDTVDPGEVVRTTTTLVSARNLEDFIGGFDHGPSILDTNTSAEANASGAMNTK
jgi:ABC-type sugar transport system substrate-binding protein